MVYGIADVVTTAIISTIGIFGTIISLMQSYGTESYMRLIISVLIILICIHQFYDIMKWNKSHKSASP